MFQSPGEIAFTIFNIPVYFYGLILAGAIFVGVYSAYLLFRKFYDKSQAAYIIDFSPFVIILGILGARLYYCLVNFSYYSAHPLEILNIRQGGLSIHGMIIIGIISLYLFAKKYGISFLKLVDAFLCATPLAQSIGRWGNFFNSEAFGMPTNLPWKLYIPLSHRPLEYINFEYFHPTFLYESVLDILIFFVLLLMFKKLAKKPGTIACLYLIMYSVIRILVEGCRVDSVLNVGGFPIAQIVSFVIILLASVSIIFLYNRKVS